MKNISMKTFMVTLGIFALLLATSCKKDDPLTPDRSELLLTGSWQLSAMTVDPPINWFGTPVTNVFSQLPACVKDDLAIFKANGTINYDEGPSKCDPNDPQTTTGAWVLNFDQTVLSITRDGQTESWDISRLSKDTFQAEYLVGEDGVTYAFSVTFIKK